MIYVRRLLLWLALGPHAYREMAKDMNAHVGSRGFVEARTVRGVRVLAGDWKRTIYGIVSGRVGL